jgi:hypothetical protein
MIANTPVECCQIDVYDHCMVSSSLVDKEVVETRGSYANLLSCKFFA